MGRKKDEKEEKDRGKGPMYQLRRMDGHQGTPACSQHLRRGEGEEEER